MFFCFLVVEDDLSQSLKNGYLLLEDEIDHVSSVVKVLCRSLCRLRLGIIEILVFLWTCMCYMFIK